MKEIFVELVEVFDLIKVKPGQSLRQRVEELLEIEWMYNDLE